MKITVEREDIILALGFCRTLLRSTEMPILTNALIRADDSGLSIASHAVYSCKDITIPAKIFEVGKTTLPLEQLYQIVSGSPANQKISILVKDRAAITFARSRYSLPTLPADQFPKMFVASGHAITLSKDERAALFNRPAQLCLTDNSMPLYSGVYLHERGGNLASIASDGTRMLCHATKHPWNGAQAVMVPRELALDIAKASASEIFWDKTILTAVEGNKRTSGRLLTVGYGDYINLVPGTDSPFLQIDHGEFLGALRRLCAMSNHASIVTIKWLSNPKEATLELGQSEAREIISCSGKIEAGAVGVAPVRLTELIALLSGEDGIRIHIAAPMKPLRIVDVADPDLLVMTAPCRIGT